MINHADIEAIIGCKTLVTDRMQRAIEDWYDAAIDGLPLDKNPETLTLDLPALICAELARLTTLELEATVEGSDRADWINAQLQRVLSPRRGASSRWHWPWAAASGSPTRVVKSWAFLSVMPPATFPLPTMWRAA